jgi:hypothetical protein
MWSMVAHHPIAGLTVDRTGPDLGRQTGEVIQENARLDDDNFFAQSSQTIGVAHGSIRLRAAAWPICKMNNQNLHSSSKEKPARAGGHLAGFSTGVAQSGLGLIADPVMTSRTNLYRSRQEPDA